MSEDGHSTGGKVRYTIHPTALCKGWIVMVRLPLISSGPESQHWGVKPIYFQLTLFKESVLTLLKLDMDQDSKFQTMAMEGDNKSDEENGGSQEVNISKPKSDYFETLCKTLSSGYCILIISIYLVIVVNNFTENKGDHSPHIEVSVNV